MNNEQLSNPCHCADDDIDLREVWQRLVEGKWLITIITAFSTFSAVLFTQVATPIYEGKVSVEVGEVIGMSMQNRMENNSMPRFLDNPADLARVIQDKLGVSASLAKGTTKIVDISYQSSDKNDIRAKLQSALDFVQMRSSEKAKLYQNVVVSETQQIAPIAVNERPVKPKTTLIIAVALVIGLMLSVFVVLVRSAVNGRRVQN